MAKRILFRVDSPLGYRVVLTRNRWREIVRFKHPALAGKDGQVRTCIAAPECVRASAKDEKVHLYYAASERGFLCVVVGEGVSHQYFVVTAYFTREIKKGKELWTK